MSHSKVDVVGIPPENVPIVVVLPILDGLSVKCMATKCFCLLIGEEVIGCDGFTIPIRPAGY